MQGLALKAEMETAFSARQMSVSGLARKASVQRGDIYRWWRGEQRPSRNSLSRIANALEWDIGALRTALGEPRKSTETADPVAMAIEALGERLEAVLRPLGEEYESRMRALEAELESLRDRSANVTSPELPVPPVTRG